MCSALPLPPALLPCGVSLETDKGASSSPAFTLSCIWPCQISICPPDVEGDGCGSPGCEKLWTHINISVSAEASQTDKPCCQIIVFTVVASSSWGGGVTHNVLQHFKKKNQNQSSFGSEAAFTRRDMAAKDLKYSCAGKALLLEKCQYIQKSSACAHTS